MNVECREKTSVVGIGNADMDVVIVVKMLELGELAEHTCEYGACNMLLKSCSSMHAELTPLCH